MATEYLSSTDTLGTWKTKINNTIGKIDAIGDTSLFATKAELDAVNETTVHLAGTETITGQKTFSSAPKAIAVELIGNTSNGGFIDFHFNNSSADFTSRIIEDSTGSLTFTASSGIKISTIPDASDNSNKIPSTSWVNKKTITKTSTIGTTWVGSESPYTQTISISDITLASIVEITLPSTATKEQIEAFHALNWTDGGQTNNSITLKAWGDRNTIEIPIIVIIRN